MKKRTHRKILWTHGLIESLQWQTQDFTKECSISSTALNLEPDEKYSKCYFFLTCKMTNVREPKTTFNFISIYFFVLCLQVFSGNEQDGLFWQPNIKVILKDSITYRFVLLFCISKRFVNLLVRFTVKWTGFALLKVEQAHQRNSLVVLQQNTGSLWSNSVIKINYLDIKVKVSPLEFIRTKSTC